MGYFWHCSGVILFHSSTTNLLNSCIFLGLRSETAALMMRHRISIVWRLCRLIQKLDSILVHPSLASSGSVTWSIVRPVGRSNAQHVWQHLDEFIIPSRTVSCPKPPALMHPQTIMLPPPCFTVAAVQAGTYSSPRILRTLTFARVGYSSKLDWSDHIIFAQCVCVHWWRSSPHRRLALLCFSATNVFFSSDDSCIPLHEPPAS